MQLEKTKGQPAVEILKSTQPKKRTKAQRPAKENWYRILVYIYNHAELKKLASRAYVRDAGH